MRIWAWLLAGATLLGTAAIATADPVTYWAATTVRVQDQLSNPEYANLRFQQADTTNADPYRAPELWAPARGRVWAVAYRNRYDAKISAHLWAPPKATGHAPYPAVVFVSGAGSSEEHYWSFAEDLAEHGYVVLTFDPQGDGRSDAAPAERYCDPNGRWRKPQEMGVREHGDCAGENGDDVSETVGQVPGVVDLVVGGHTGQQRTLDVQDLYRQIEPNYVFGALDARDYLVSSRSPVRTLVDQRRVAVVGHSIGAYAAALTGNGDPERRFAAAVSMDSYAHLMHGVRPRVPTLYLQSEQEFFSGPRLAPPPPTALHATRADYTQFRHAGLPVMFGVLASSTHQEFEYVGPEAHLPASSTGQRVASYYVLAWLDRWLRGSKAAGRRLVAKRFDASVDSSSIGLGHWNPVTMTNEPYRISGSSVRDALSSYYVSRADFGTHHCIDLRSARVC
jgi:pimeloyl-ACP methyl ester carboxylesterase